MKRIKRDPYIIKVSEADFYTIRYALTSLHRRVNANGYEIKRIIDKLDQIIDERQKKEALGKNESTN